MPRYLQTSIHYHGAVYRLASVAEKEVENLLLAILPKSPFANKVYAVGGYVRDEVMGLQSKDLDIMVTMPDGAENLAKYVHEKFLAETSNPYQMGKSYPIWHIAFKTDIQHDGKIYTTKGAEIDFADSQKESFPDETSRQRDVQFGTFDEDIMRRDFTVNMLTKDMTTGKLVDTTGTSISDIKNGILRLHPDVNPDKPFSDDALRMLRLIRFMVKYGWKVDLGTLEAVKRNAHRIESISAERIMEELSKIMRLGKLAQAIRFMSDTGLLKHVMPEIEALKGVEQPKKFHAEGDVFEHTMAVLEHTKPTVEAQLAALLHDVGKPATQKFLEGKIQFLGHEDVSVEIAEAFMRRLKMDNATITKVVPLVKNHMRAHTSLEWGPKAIRKFVREMGEYLEDVLDLTAADALGRKMDEDVSRQGDDYIKDLRERIKKTNEIPISTKPVLNGKEIMDILNVKPGPEVGKASRWLQEQSDDLATEGKELTPELARELLKTQYHKTAYYKGAEYRIAEGSRILYHVGKRPAVPYPLTKFKNDQDPPFKWYHHYPDVGVFLTSDPNKVQSLDYIVGNVYAYEVPEWVIKEAGGLHRIAHIDEVVIPASLWPHCKFLGRNYSKEKPEKKLMRDQVRFFKQLYRRQDIRDFSPTTKPLSAEQFRTILKTKRHGEVLQHKGTRYRLVKSPVLYHMHYTVVGGLGPYELSGDHVAGILAAQPGNREKRTARQLKAKWVASDRFVLTEIYAMMPQFGVTEGKSGLSASEGLPIIIDKNIQDAAALPNGTVPPYMVIDGQNRVTAARRHGSKTIKIQAYVGNLILDKVRKLVTVWAIKYDTPKL